VINTSAQNTIKNSVYNFIGFILPIVILVFFTPIIIRHLGVQEYGIFIFLNTVLTFLGLLDLGIGTATNKHIVEYYSTNQIDRFQKLLHSMNSIYLIMAFVYFFVCVTIGFVMQKFWPNSEIAVNYLVLFTIIGATGFVGTILANFNNALVVLQRYDLYLKISMTFLLLSNIGMLILAMLGYKLAPILLLQFLLAIASTLTYYFAAKKNFSELKLKYDWDKTELIKNYKFALPVAFNNLANSSLVHFDKLLVPIFCGSAQLTYYSVPGSISTKISSISGTFSSLLFPITVNLHALNDQEKIRRVYIRSVRLITILSSAMALSIIFTGDKILLYWLGAGFLQQSLIVLILSVLTNFILAIFSPLSSLLMATNRMKFLTASSFAMAGINIVALFLFLPKYGINGAALAYLISVLFIFFMFNFAERKYFLIKNSGHFKLLLKLTATSIIFFGVVHFLLYPFIINFLTLAIIGPFCVLVFLLLYKLLGFVEAEDWNDFVAVWDKTLVKFNIKKDKMVIERISETCIAYNTGHNICIREYYLYIIDLFKKQLKIEDLKLNIIFGDYNINFKNNYNTIKIDIQYEHTLVKPGGRGSANAIIGKIPIKNSDNKYLIRINNYDYYKNIDGIIEYSMPNIVNISSSHVYLDYVKKVSYISPLIYNLEFDGIRTINCITLFGDVNQTRRKELLDDIKNRGFNSINVNNCFDKDELKKIYKNTKILINICQI